jgi:hypothetical protein
LRGLEGYWYPGVRRLLTPLTTHQQKRRDHLIQKLSQLNPSIDRATSAERAEFVRCDGKAFQGNRALRQYPTQEHDILPTRLGNILRAAERRPRDRYGLDAIICWPRLWLLPPEPAKQELQAARAELNNSARLVLWSLLFLVWSIWAKWATLLGLLSVLLAYR